MKDKEINSILEEVLDDKKFLKDHGLTPETAEEWLDRQSDKTLLRLALKYRKFKRPTVKHFVYPIHQTI